jgi:hypothetical protein
MKNRMNNKGFFRSSQYSFKPHVQNLTQSQINLSICDATTIFPAHLVHPIAMLKVVRKINVGWGDRNQISVLVPNSRD